MIGFGHLISKHRRIVLLLAALLLLPAIYGTITTKINYDILTYLPEDLESVKGQNILGEVFNDSATGMLVIEGMEDRDILRTKEKVGEVSGVDNVTWIDDLVDISVPNEMLPDSIREVFFSENSTLLMVNFHGDTSDPDTHRAIEDIRLVLGKESFLSGMATILRDTRNLADKQTPIYVGLAVVLATIVLALALESTVVPFVIMLSIGFAVLYNFGTNSLFGEISYVTKSLAAVLQLGVTLDYSIFLLHRYEEESGKYDNKEEAMAHAIANTASSIVGSSLTTIAGFLAIAAMELTIGKDIGFVMAKGVVFGVISVLTVLPALILSFDKLIKRFSHGTLLPEFNSLAKLVTKHYRIFILVGLLIFIPAFYGQANNDIYYNLDESLPKDMESVIALNKLKDDFNMMTTHMLVLSGDVPSYRVKEMIREIEELDGIENVLSYQTFLGSRIPEDFIPDEIKSRFEKGDYKQLLINSGYKAAMDEGNRQIEEIQKIVKKYDPDSFLTGEGVLTKDLIDIADTDFKRVNTFSNIAVFAIILLVFTSISIPVLLILAITLAIFINMAVPFYTGESIPFIASIVIGSIQLGATVDYAILLTTRFREEIQNGYDKFTAMEISVRESSKSIVTSGLAFFASTVGVALVSEMELVKSLSGMIAKGALISTAVILFILPGILLAGEGIIKVTSINWKKDNVEKEQMIYENK